MRRQEKADRIGEILDDLYPEIPIPLDHRDPYTLLVAVALLTTVVLTQLGMMPTTEEMLEFQTQVADLSQRSEQNQRDGRV